MPATAQTAVAVIGIDIGKNSFHIVGLDSRGAIVCQKWSRGQVEARLANMSPCQIGMEACVGAHHLSKAQGAWSRRGDGDYRFDILPRMVRSPVEICFGTRPSQAAKSRPLENASPLPIAATIALEIIGPMPGTRFLAASYLRVLFVQAAWVVLIKPQSWERHGLKSWIAD